MAISKDIPLPQVGSDKVVYSVLMFNKSTEAWEFIGSSYSESDVESYKYSPEFRVNMITPMHKAYTLSTQTIGMNVNNQRISKVLPTRHYRDKGWSVFKPVKKLRNTALLNQKDLRTGY